VALTKKMQNYVKGVGDGLRDLLLEFLGPLPYLGNGGS